METNLFEDSNLPPDVLRNLNKLLKDQGMIFAKVSTSQAPLIIFVNSFQSEQEVFRKHCQHLQFTQRETEIALLIEEGFSYKEIGKQLHISVKTVSRHIHNLYFKAEVSNKTALVRRLKGIS